ncbi:MAG: gamma-glutamyltransferase [Planctomycetota bacterium]
MPLAPRRSSGAFASLLGILWLGTLAPVQAAPEKDEPVAANHGLVVAEQPLAARIGVDVLKAGGNAVDAAVATAFALAVVHPQAGNIGGGGFAVVRLADGTVTTLDFREKAPGRAHRDMYLGDDGDVIRSLSTFSHLASGVPGSVAGLCALRDRHGSLPLEKLLEPAIALAEDGFEIDQWLGEDIAGSSRRFERYESSKKIFFKDGAPRKQGDRLVQKDLAETLRKIARLGPAGFYTGDVAEKIVAEMKRGGGWISLDDLKRYEAVWREPIRFDYRGYTLFSMPPPSSGGVALAQILGMLEPFDLGGAGFGSAAAVHRMAEVLRRVYADRATYLGDSDFFDVPIAQLVSDEYLKSRAATISRWEATPSTEVKEGELIARESDDTTHFSIVDAEGNAVAITTTINYTFGSHIVVDGAGFLLNNEMDDFSSKPGVPNIYGLVGGEANAIQPNKRMLSSMTPTIITQGDRLFMVVGAPGGSRIITGVAQVILNVIDHGMNVAEAVNARRIHHQWLPDELRTERFALSPDTMRLLRGMGHDVKVRAGGIARVQAIVVDDKGVRHGASDPRGGGAAVGY